MKLYQIIEGVHKHHYDEAGLKVLPGHTGAVTLAHGEAGKVLIDTGSRAAWPEVKANLGNLGVMPEDIEVVLLTHFHLDHTFNVAHFTRARVFGWTHEWTKDATVELVPDIDKEGIPGLFYGFWSLRAPGHDECLNAYFTDQAESITLRGGTVIDLNEKLICLSGDALNQPLLESNGGRLHYTYDKALLLRSAQRILDQNPDYILPGHGPVISRPETNWPQVT